MTTGKPRPPFAVRLWGGLQMDREALAGNYRPALFALLAVCFVLRLALAWLLPNIHQADEIYQVAEQANRTLHGYGIVSWEFQTSSRPALLAAMVTPIYALRASAAGHEFLSAALFSALSLIPIWVAFQWVARLYGVRSGLLAGFLMGTWFELVYFAPKATADAVCADFFMAALFLGRPAARTWSVALAGFSIAIALGIRIQILPAVGFAVLCLAALDGRSRRLALAAGLLAGLTLVGGVEWAWWGVPFEGHWRYLEMEFAHHASAHFGHEPMTFFLKNAVLLYGGALPVIAALVYAGARRASLLLLLLAAIVVPFHVIGHKEYRFMMPAVPVMVLLIGIGVAASMQRLAPGAGTKTWAALAAGWLIAMIAMSLGDSFRPFWFRDRNQILAFRDIGAQPDACGIGLESIRWYHTPGYSGVGRDVPLYEMLTPDDMRHLEPAANYIVAATKATPPPAPYVAWRQYSRPVQIVYRRPGGCAPDAAAKIERPPIPVGAVE